MLKRIGECKRCGKCCTTFYLYQSMTLLEKVIIRWKLWRKGQSLNKDTSRCDKLRFRRRKAICKKYDKRPEFCKGYPDQPTLIEGCGFEFVEDEGRTWPVGTKSDDKEKNNG